MRISDLMILVAAPLALAACDRSEDAETTDIPRAENVAVTEDMPMQNDMPMMKTDEKSQTASAQGSVTAIDNAAGTITISHGPVPAVNWPAMTMAFEADEAARRNVSIGDDVSFEFRPVEGGARITSIETK